MSLKEEYLKMDGANQFLLEHCEKTLGEIVRAYRGISHSMNRCNAEYVDCWAAVSELTEEVEALAKAIRDANAAIGKLQERQDKIAAWLKEKFSKTGEQDDRQSNDKASAGSLHQE